MSFLSSQALQKGSLYPGLLNFFPQMNEDKKYILYFTVPSFHEGFQMHNMIKTFILMAALTARWRRGHW
jgi:hypothetical protein